MGGAGASLVRDSRGARPAATGVRRGLILASVGLGALLAGSAACGSDDDAEVTGPRIDGPQPGEFVDLLQTEPPQATRADAGPAGGSP